MTAAILLAKQYRQNAILMFLAALLMISVCWQLAKMIGENKFASWMSRHNFTIYIYSWLFQAVTMVVCAKCGFLWWMTTSCMFAVGLLAPAAMIYIYEHSVKIQNNFFDLVLGMK